MLHLPPLALYIHIPWCVRKCPYCDFNSHTADGTLPEQDYVAALIADLHADLAWVQGRTLTSIFFGGGTPSLFSARAIGEILTAVDAVIGIAPNVEITLEANPGTFEQEKFRGYRGAGVNRLSLGMQSFNDDHLKTLGRIHSGADAVKAATAARAAGFDNINLDLMHGLPGQTVAQAGADLHQAIALEPTHISWYQLTIEPNTAFYRTRPQLPMEATLEAIQTVGQAILAAAGYPQYEISAYARGGRQSVHNRNYWEFGDYLGIGAGAHGKITGPAQGQILRTRKTRHPRDYLARVDQPRIDSTAIAPAELPQEFLLNALRLNQGVPTRYFAERTGLAFATIDHRWQQLATKGLVEKSPDRLAATALGLRFLNDVLAAF